MAERQLAKDLGGIRMDHLARYFWAAGRLAGSQPPDVVDIGCGCGYGAWILASAGVSVRGIDRCADAVGFASEHWADSGARFECREAHEIDDPHGSAVMFEVIEHIEDPAPTLRAAGRCAQRLLGSVPCEYGIRFDKVKFPFHHRHYTWRSIKDVLNAAGWVLTEQWHQPGRYSAVAPGPGTAPRTLVFEAIRP